MIEYIYKKFGFINKELYEDDKLEDCLGRAMSDIQNEYACPEEIKKDGILLYEHFEILEKWSKVYRNK